MRLCYLDIINIYNAGVYHYKEFIEILKTTSINLIVHTKNIII